MGKAITIKQLRQAIGDRDAERWGFDYMSPVTIKQLGEDFDNKVKMLMFGGNRCYDDYNGFFQFCYEPKTGRLYKAYYDTTDEKGNYYDDLTDIDYELPIYCKDVTDYYIDKYNNSNPISLTKSEKLIAEKRKLCENLPRYIKSYFTDSFLSAFSVSQLNLIVAVIRDVDKELIKREKQSYITSLGPHVFVHRQTGKIVEIYEGGIKELAPEELRESWLNYTYENYLKNGYKKFQMK